MKKLITILFLLISVYGFGQADGKPRYDQLKPIPASHVTEFQDSVNTNANVVANTAARHVAVTTADVNNITVTGQELNTGSNVPLLKSKNTFVDDNTFGVPDTAIRPLEPQELTIATGFYQTGNIFKPLADGQVSKLGVYPSSGASHTINLYNQATEVKIATTTISSATSDEWNYQAITPVNIYKDSIYIVAPEIAGNSAKGGYANLDIGDLIHVFYGVYGNDGSMPTISGGGSGIYGADIEFTADIITTTIKGILADSDGDAGIPGQIFSSTIDGTNWIDNELGDVTAASAFGTDNRMIISDGTGKGVQATGIEIDANDNVSGISEIEADNVIQTHQTLTETAGASTMDYTSGSDATIVIDEGTTLAITNTTTGSTGQIIVIQDDADDDDIIITVSGVSVEWKGGLKELTDTNAAVDIITYKRIGFYMYLTLDLDYK